MLVQYAVHLRLITCELTAACFPGLPEPGITKKRSQRHRSRLLLHCMLNCLPRAGSCSHNVYLSEFCTPVVSQSMLTLVLPLLLLTVQSAVYEVGRQGAATQEQWWAAGGHTALLMSVSNISTKSMAGVKRRRTATEAAGDKENVV